MKILFKFYFCRVYTMLISVILNYKQLQHKQPYNQVKKDTPLQPPNQLTDKNLQIVRAVSPGSDSGTDNTEYWDKK